MARRPRYSQLQLLEHVIELCDVTVERVGDKSFEDFVADRDLLDATAYRLQAIGGACGKLSGEIKGAHALPWADIIGMRHILSHDYLAISKRIVWETARGNLGELRAACAASAEAEKRRA